MMNPTEFEQQVARIVTILEGTGAKVKWDDKLTDPDNPKQKRQIDVTVCRDKLFTIIECRLHSRPQDVQWIEELYGRRASLSANAVIGVSSSGFTAGAIRKAERLGVFLRKLTELTDEEIRCWGHRTTVCLSYVHFPRGAEIFLVPNTRLDIPIRDVSALFVKKDGSSWPLSLIFQRAANKLAMSRVPEGVIRMQFFTEELFIGSAPVNELIMQAEWKWVLQEMTLPYALSFSDPSKHNDSNTIVEKNNYSKTEIFHTPKHVTITIDVSLNPPLERSYLQSVRVDLKQPLAVGGVGIIGSNETHLTLFPLSVNVINRSSPKYQALTSESGLQIIT